MTVHRSYLLKVRRSIFKQIRDINFLNLYIYITCKLSSKIDQLPKFSLTNGMWIENVLPFLLKLTIVEKTLIAQFHSFTILITI
jgi:hypothetical protein